MVRFANVLRTSFHKNMGKKSQMLILYSMIGRAQARAIGMLETTQKWAFKNLIYCATAQCNGEATASRNKKIFYCCTIINFPGRAGSATNQAGLPCGSLPKRAFGTGGLLTSTFFVTATGSVLA